MIDTIVDIADGNPGAAKALSAIWNQRSDYEEVFDTMRDHDICGPEVWVGFKDHCDFDVDEFADKVKSEDEDMFEEIMEYRERRREFEENSQDIE